MPLAKPARILLFAGLLSIGKQTAASSTTVLPRPGVWDIHWGLSLGGADFEGPESSKKIALSRFDFTWRLRAHESVLLKVSPSLRLETGAVQSGDGSLRSENGFQFSEASVNWSPISRQLFQMGALNQQDIHADLLVGERPFPGLRWTSALVSGRFWLRARIEGAVPTSQGLTTNQKEKESTPTLSTVGLRMGFEGARGFKGEWAINHYAFQGLPSSTAHESSLLGNTVDRFSDTESRFRQDYRGFETWGALQMPVSGPLDVSSRGGFIRNTSVDTGLGDGWNAAVGAHWGPEHRQRWNIEAEAFRIEPDAAVASFVGSAYRGTNRQGYATLIGLTWSRDYKVGVRFEESDVIFVNEPQGRERYLKIHLETRHAGL